MSPLWLCVSLLISVVSGEIFVAHDILVDELKEAVINNRYLIDKDHCRIPLNTLYESFLTKKFEKWQLEMIDASTKIPSGFLSGNIVDLGNFDECISIEEKISVDEKNETMLGQYCQVAIPLKLFGIGNVERHQIIDQTRQLYNKSEREPEERIVNLIGAEPLMTWSICIPSGCKDADINHLIHLVPKLSEVNVYNCQTKELNTELTAGDWGFISFLIIIGLLMVLSTAYDVYIEKTKLPRPHIAFFAFSVYSNGKKLMSTSKNPDTLPCLNGIRFLSMVWVIFGHAYYARLYSPVINTLYSLQWWKKLMAMTVVGATVSVDSFFVLGGMVMVYVFMKAHDKGIGFNIPMYYLHRYIRLTPALAAVMVAHITILRYFGSGPLWPIIMSSLETNCRKRWWSVLLYVQNYVNPNEQCLGQTWYLSVDMQLFIISPLILLMLARWEKHTIKFMYFAVIMGMVSPFAVAYVYELPALIPLSLGNPNFMKEYYLNTYTRFGPWVVGIILGYHVHKRHENRWINNMLKIWWFNISCWILAIAILLLVVYAPNNIIFHEYNIAESSIFLGMHRVVWSIALSWIIYVCIMGHGGIINWFLSLTPFQIMSRLTYSMYLTHLSFQFIRIGLVRVPLRFNDFDIIHGFFGDFFFTVCFAMLVTLAFESPMITVEKIIFGKAKPRKTESKENIIERPRREIV